MRAYLPAAALGVAFLAWLMSGSGREGATEARDVGPGLDLRRALAEGPRQEPAAAAREATARVEASGPRRSVRIVYPPPYEAR